MKNSKNHYFYKQLYQQENNNIRPTFLPRQSRLSFRKASMLPDGKNLYQASDEEVQIARKVRLLSEDEQKDEEKRLARLKQKRVKEIVQKIKAEEKFFFNINRIREKIKDKRQDLYLGKTFVSFRKLDMCVIFLKMFQADLQKEVLADANQDRYDYLLHITTKIAPFIDDLRWEHMYPTTHYYIVEITFVLVISTVNLFLEKMYNTSNLEELVINKKGLRDPSWILQLLVLLLLQVLLSVVSVVALEKLISRYTFYKRSKKIEINFIFFNFFMVLNNIMVVFYGFLWAAYDMSVNKLQDDNKYKYNFNFYINFQWIKNGMIIIFIPLLQRIIGDYILKWHVIPFVGKLCKKKKPVEKEPEVPMSEQKPSTQKGDLSPIPKKFSLSTSPPKEPTAYKIEKEHQMIEKEIEVKLANSSQDEAEAVENALEQMKNSPLEDPIPDPEDFSSEESEEEEGNPEVVNVAESVIIRKRPIHDFGLNSSYMIQVSFFAGFYLSFTSPALLLVTFLGMWLNFKCEDLFLKSIYDKTRYVSISNLFVTVRWAFLAFCVGMVLSVFNTKLYIYIINFRRDQASAQPFLVSKLSGFQNMIGYCNFVIALIFFFQMSTGKIMFRVLNSIENLKRKFGGSFFKNEFEKVNYKSQNPFYSF